MYIPLFNRTTYTFLSSLLEVDDLVSFAKENNLEYMAICDQNMFGTMEFITKCQANRIKPVIGVEFHDRILFARNYCGYQNLLKLTSLQTEKKLDDNDFQKYKSDVICIPLKEINLIYIDVFFKYAKEDSPNENSIYINKLLYKNEKDAKILTYLELLRDNKTITDDYQTKNNYYYTNKEDIPKVCLKNTYKLCGMCNLELPKYELNLPKYQIKENISSETYLFNLSMKGMKKRLENKIENIYLDRLKYELNVIFKMGFANYFLIVYDFIRFAKNQGILVGPGRGSAAGSLVSYSLGITDVDPIKYDLLFERFLNIERITMPDIDIDFPDIYRDKIIKYVNEKYGSKHVSNIVTFGTMGAKLAIRDIGRVMNVPTNTIDRINKIIGYQKNKLIEIYSTNKELREIIDSDNKLKRLFEISARVEGIKRHTSVHAAGIIISNDELDELVPLIKDTDNDSYITGYEAGYLENLGLLKMDFLGLKNLTTIMEIIENINVKEKINIDFNKIPLDDLKTIEIFQNGDTNGIFQFESNGMKSFLKQLRPNSFDNVASAMALYRPGPANSIPLFINRKDGIEKIDYLHENLKKILEPTYGIIVYQEQIMQIANVMAGYTLGEADILRRAMSKKKRDALENEREKFINGSIQNGYSKELAIKVYDLILRFASYGFNKSHSVAYTIIAYKMAFLKRHYPLYFYISLLNSVIGDISKTKEYMYEIKKYNIKILNPDINNSNCEFQVKDGQILCPFTLIKGISRAICNSIIEVRKERFKDIYDFFDKTKAFIPKNYELLITSGTLDCLGFNRQTLFYNLESLINYGQLCQELEVEYVLKPELTLKDEYTSNDIIDKEKQIYGFFLTNHPTLSYKLKEKNIVNLIDIESNFNKEILTIVLVEKIKEIVTKRGEKMIFLTGNDEEGQTEFILFPKIYEIYYTVKKNDIIKVLGKVERRNGNYQIIVSKIEIMN